MANSEYTTKQGDRWDTIAEDAYGDASAINPIQDANPNIPITDVFDGGITLIIPVIEEQADSNLDLLPPWKKVQANVNETEIQAIATQMNQITGLGLSYDKSYD